MYYINEEEKRVLQAIAKGNDENKEPTFYQLVDLLKIESNMLIPVASRLEEDGYIKSKGVIQRYFRITDKGRKEL